MFRAEFLDQNEGHDQCTPETNSSEGTVCVCFHVPSGTHLSLFHFRSLVQQRKHLRDLSSVLLCHCHMNIFSFLFYFSFFAQYCRRLHSLSSSLWSRSPSMSVLLYISRLDPPPPPTVSTCRQQM
jgi:hypothetical protein